MYVCILYNVYLLCSRYRRLYIDFFFHFLVYQVPLQVGVYLISLSLKTCKSSRKFFSKLLEFFYITFCSNCLLISYSSGTSSFHFPQFSFQVRILFLMYLSTSLFVLLSLLHRSVIPLGI